MLVQTAELQKKLGEAGLVILDARPSADYTRGHIPGARRVEVPDWQRLAAREGGLHDAAAWGKEVSPLGIERRSHVVVYGSSLPDTARVWWTLKYLGVPEAAVLDGGWELWAREKRPEDTSTPVVSPSSFEPRFQADRLEEMAPLIKALKFGRVTVVDARSTDEFSGKEVRGKRGGHIPGARHLEWKELVGPDGRFKTPEQLRDLFRRRGVEPDRAAVTC
jgi:thiosulfate/3-mercaptopyruvate sulfurtransferase